ncbi:MAG: cell division protein ZapA [Bryobacteraceae bacterium]
MNPAEKRSVRVTLLGQTYNVLAPGDPVEFERLAQRVDDLMHELARKLPNTDSQKIAVLACLHLADQLESIEKVLADLQDRVDRASEHCAQMLDQALSE